jgi:hypothetical protein
VLAVASIQTTATNTAEVAAKIVLSEIYVNRGSVFVRLEKYAVEERALTTKQIPCTAGPVATRAKVHKSAREAPVNVHKGNFSAVGPALTPRPTTPTVANAIRPAPMALSVHREHAKQHVLLLCKLVATNALTNRLTPSTVGHVAMFVVVAKHALRGLVSVPQSKPIVPGHVSTNKPANNIVEAVEIVVRVERPVLQGHASCSAISKCSAKPSQLVTLLPSVYWPFVRMVVFLQRAHKTIASNFGISQILRLPRSRVPSQLRRVATRMT